MNSNLVRYSLDGGVATITMDDGKNNLLGPAMLSQLNAALDRAEKDQAVVLLCGREQTFSAGFDLGIIKSSPKQAFGMLIAGFKLSARLLAFPTPVVIAAPGHAVAMGSFLLLSADYRVGAAGDFKIMANDVAIGMTMPYSIIEICRARLNPGHLNRVVSLSECYNPNSAVAAGFLDQVVAADELQATAKSLATNYTKLDLQAHAQSKLRLKNKQLKVIKRAIVRDRFALVKMGIIGAMQSSKPQ